MDPVHNQRTDTRRTDTTAGTRNGRGGGRTMWYIVAAIVIIAIIAIIAMSGNDETTQPGVGDPAATTNAPVTDPAPGATTGTTGTTGTDVPAGDPAVTDPAPGDTTAPATDPVTPPADTGTTTTPPAAN